MALTSLPVTNVPRTALSLVPLVPFLRHNDSHLESIIVRETGIQGARQMAGDMSHRWPLALAPFQIWGEGWFSQACRHKGSGHLKMAPPPACGSFQHPSCRPDPG